MTNYPDINWANDKDHLLFDIGFSYAIIARMSELLSQFKAGERISDNTAGEIDDFDQVITEFLAKRLAIVDQIYEAVYNMELPDKPKKKETK